MGDRTHQGLIAVFEMAVDHVVVPLVYGQIDRFTYRAAGVVYPRCHVGELDEVAEVFNGGVAATLVKIMDEGRSVGRHQHGSVTTDGHIASRVSRVLNVFFWGSRLNNRSTKSRCKTDTGAVDIGTCLFKQFEDLRIV